MRKLFLSIVTVFVVISCTAQTSSLKNLNKSKAPNFALEQNAPDAKESTIATGPVEKNIRNKPWTRENKPVSTVTKKRILGPKGKYLMNRVNN